MTPDQGDLAVPPPLVSRKIHGEMTLLLGWSSAILLQFAHPLVARGVADHSGFRADRDAPWRRLQSTLSAMLALTFGTAAEAAEALRRINGIHDRIHGSLREAAGPFAAGTPYSAHDPDLLRWVHATCLTMFMRAYERYVGALTPAERDAYCAEGAHVEQGLGMPEGFLPRTVAALDVYMDSMYRSGVIVVTDTARELARALLAPPVPLVTRPVTACAAVLAVGLLPPTIRAAYGFRWSAAHRLCCSLAGAAIRGLLPVVPAPLRYWPAARSVRRRGVEARASGWRQTLPHR